MQTGYGEPHRTVDLDRRYAEQSGLGGVGFDPQVGTGKLQRIADVAGAGRSIQQALHLTRKPVEHRKIGADDAHRNRRRDGRTVSELEHRDPRTRIAVETYPKRIEVGWRASRVVFFEHPEHFGIRGGLLSLDVVVVHLRVAAAEVRGHRSDARYLVHLSFDEAQCAVGLRIAGTGRGVDLHQELRRIGFREQTGTEHRYQQHRRQQGATDGDRDGGFRSGQAIVQGGPVVAMDAIHNPLQQPVSFSVLFFAQHAARKERDDEERDQQRADDGRDHGGRQYADELAGGTR